MPAWQFGNNAQQLLCDCVCDPQALTLPDRQMAFAGSGLAAYSTPLKEQFGGRAAVWLPDRIASARDVAELAAVEPASAACTAQTLNPSYVRDQVAALPADKKNTAQSKN